MKVYWHSRKRMWSCVNSGKVTSHENYVDLEDCRFKVNEAGRKRVVMSGTKNVHAYITGIPSESTSIGDRLKWVQVRYNPFSMDQFIRIDNNQPVYAAARVFMNAHGQVFADIT